MLAQLDPDQEVPDAIYLAALEHAVTPEEIIFRDVLVFHRDILNGGLDQALSNRENDDEELAPVVSAYRSVGLPAVASLVDDAAVLWRNEANVDELSERYFQVVYGEENDRPDAIERAAVRYAQHHWAAFTSIADAAARGDFKTFDFGGLG